MTLASTTVLIPAAGRVPEGVLALANVGTPAMIPVGGRPVIHWTLRYLVSLGLRRFVVAVPKRGLFIEEYVESVFGDSVDVRFIVPGLDGGVGLTVRDLAQQAGDGPALVVLGDTYFRFADPAVLQSGEPFVLTHAVDDPYRWCVVQIATDGRVSRLLDKEPSLEGTHEALVGVYGFPDGRALQEAADAAVKASQAEKRRTELSAILTRIHAQAPIRAVRAGEWLDCGNPDRQAASHRALLQSRDFNELSIDPVLGTITKRSRKKEKFVDEINYLRLLPKELAVLFPRVLDASTRWDDPYLTMEYYGYPSLSEVFVFENVDPGIWEQIFRHLLEVVEKGFLAAQRPLPRGALSAMLLDKTRARLDAISGPPSLLELAGAREVTINGRTMPGIVARWSQIERAVERLEESAVGSIVHGDLCFSNILYDLRSRIVKLVDPRGSFGGAGIYGDIRYDIAKLYHSVRGGYDLIVNDLFRVEAKGSEVTLNLRAKQRHEEILRRFERIFFPRFDRREIALITATLFASMPALHYDAPKRQIAMLARAIELFDEALRDG